jgi:hypothetical protein
VRSWHVAMNSAYSSVWRSPHSPPTKSRHPPRRLRAAPGGPRAATAPAAILPNPAGRTGNPCVGPCSPPRPPSA